jgi:ketosteroid isomerase-like protein
MALMKNKALAAVTVWLIGCAALQASGRAAAEDGSADSRAVSETIASFEAALRAGDFGRVSALLDPQLLVFEAGGAERSRDEYLAEHAKADAEFLKGARVEDGGTAVTVAGDAAWSTKTSVLQFERDGKPAAVYAAETMILRRGPDGWKIVHIHWSSRAKP